jgi:hypothetical protein
MKAQPNEYTGGAGLAPGAGLPLGGILRKPLLLQDAITTSSANAARNRVGPGPAAILIVFPARVSQGAAAEASARF